MTELEEKIYSIVKSIPRGKVLTYGAIAAALGNKHLCRVVGNVLHKNPIPYDKDKLLKDGLIQSDKVPCHRVVNSKGFVAKNFGLGGASVQEQMLLSENIEVKNSQVDLKKYLFKM